jgi:hypothetical protein
MKLRTVLMALALCALASAPLGCGDDDDGDHDHAMGDHDKAGGGGKGSAGSGASNDAGVSKDAGDSDDDEKLEVAGKWMSMFSEDPVEISLEDWDGAEVVAFDNDENEAVTHNPDDAMYSPDTYSKVVWTEPGDDGFYYCIVDFGLESKQAAADSDKVADDSDPENSGCGMFGWTKLTPL